MTSLHQENEDVERGLLKREQELKISIQNLERMEQECLKRIQTLESHTQTERNNNPLKSNDVSFVSSRTAIVIPTGLTRQISFFDVERSLPKPWKNLMNDNGEIVWNFQHTMLCKLLGLERSRKIVFVLFGSFVRMMVYATFGTINFLAFTAGFYKLIPPEAYFVTMSLLVLWMIYTLFMLNDLQILRQMTMMFSFFVHIFILFFRLWSMGYLFRMDYRVIGYFIIEPLVNFCVFMIDSQNQNFRRFVCVPLVIAVLVREFFLLVSLNIGLVPDVDPNVTLFSMNWVPGVDIKFSAIGIYNQSFAGFFVLMIHFLFQTIINIWGGKNRLIRFRVVLEGSDDPNSGPIEKFNFLENLFACIKS